jgi:hypothetical protein
MRDRVLAQALRRAARPQRPAPFGTGHITPPLGDIAQVDRPVGGVEDQRPRPEQGRIHAGVLRRIQRALGHRHISGRGHEPAELGDGHRVVIHPEPIDLDPADRALLGAEILRAHHARGGRADGGARADLVSGHVVILSAGGRPTVEMAAPGSPLHAWLSLPRRRTRGGLRRLHRRDERRSRHHSDLGICRMASPRPPARWVTGHLNPELPVSSRPLVSPRRRGPASGRPGRISRLPW